MFDGQVNTRPSLVEDESLRDLLRDGAAYAFVVGGSGLSSIVDTRILMQIIQVYSQALRVV